MNNLFARLVAIALLITSNTVLARPITVVVDPVLEENFNQTQSFIGRVIANESGAIAADVAGRVIGVQVEIGDRVTTNQVLASLDKQRLQIAVELAEARMQEAQARVEAENLKVKQAQLNLDRQLRLKGSPAFSLATFEDRELDVANLKAELLATQSELGRYIAELELARLNLQRSDIRAPYDGLIIEKNTQAGAYITIGDEIVHLVNEKDLEIEVNIPRKLIPIVEDISKIKISDELAGDSYAILRSIVRAENRLSRTVSLRLRPSQSILSKLIVNQSITVLIPISTTERVFTISKDALINRQGQFFVYIVEDGQANLKPITLGKPSGSRYEVIDGVNLGDLVVVRGNERLQPNQPVNYTIRGEHNAAH